MTDVNLYPGSRAFFEYARRRYGLLLRKQEGLPPPWTDDKILQGYRFCNVFREDDKTTIWFRENIRDPLRDNPDVVFATIAFRMYNRIGTGKLLIEHNLLQDWDGDRAVEVFKDVHPLVTGAYMVKTPSFYHKNEGVALILNPIWMDRHRLVRDIEGIDTLEALCTRLRQYAWVGGFMSYEFATDLRHTSFPRTLKDINTWASVGPGAQRGIQRVVNDDVNKWIAPRFLQGHLSNLLEMSRDKDIWPRYWPQWEMREVEHTLCEFDKYERARLLEGRPKQNYVAK